MKWRNVLASEAQGESSPTCMLLPWAFGEEDSAIHPYSFSFMQPFLSPCPPLSFPSNVCVLLTVCLCSFFIALWIEFGGRIELYVWRHVGNAGLVVNIFQGTCLQRRRTLPNWVWTVTAWLHVLNEVWRLQLGRLEVPTWVWTQSLQRKTGRLPPWCLVAPGLCGKFLFCAGSWGVGRKNVSKAEE